ncbi:MAG TPA: HAD family hydrolase [Streptosporangiaceae bacterium]|nr:HAD family hydrolase [Streptosporangiaceae bacterium]
MRAPRRVRAVLLDIDDTLVDTRAAFRFALGEVLGEWLPHLDAAGLQAATLYWAADPGGHFRAYTRGDLDFATQRRRRAADLHARFGGPSLDDAGFGRWEAAYEAAFRSAWRATPDALGLLEALAAAGLAIGAVTNQDSAYQRAKLAAVGLDGRFATLVGIDVLGRGKPDPRVFRLACDRLGVDPAEAAYVGDELDVDARGARDAGLIGVWLDRHGVRGSGTRPDDVPVVGGLAEVPALLGLADGSGR